jgi:hypothetical protein
MKSLLLVSVFTMIACTQDSGEQYQTGQGSLSKTVAASASPSGLTCEVVYQVPLSRGQGSGLEGKYRQNDIVYYPAYLRGDVNADGAITIEDGKMATQQLFKLADVKCQATADVAGYPATATPDGAVTSIDITTFNNYRHTGVITWPQDVICEYNCAVVNQPPGSY